MTIELKSGSVPAEAPGSCPKETHSSVSLRLDPMFRQGARLLERRSEARYPTREPVKVQILDANITGCIAGTVLDVSRSGLRIQLEEHIAKGSRVEIIFPRTLVIFGEVRYFHRVGIVQQAGILIKDVFRARPLPDEHIHSDRLALFIVGKGLNVGEVIGLTEHLMRCELCQVRLAETNAMLNPIRKRQKQ